MKDNKIKATRQKKYDTRLYIKISTDDKDKIQTLAKVNKLTTNEMVRRILKTQLDLFANQMTIYNETIKNKDNNQN